MERIQNKFPPFLREGDRVALVSPSYRLDPEGVQRAMQQLRDWGFRVSEPTDRTGAAPYAGTVSDRVRELSDAFRNPEIRAVFCTRGGYGAIQLLPLLPEDLFRADPKWLVGFSDISTLHAASLRQGVVSIHGPMGSTFGKDAQSDRCLRDLLEGRFPAYSVPAGPGSVQGRAEGILSGGNLATIIPLLGTAFDPVPEDCILFVEEVGETLHNIDRMWQTLALHGALRRIRGLVLGDFTETGMDLGAESAQGLLSAYAASLGIPVLTGFPTGHATKNLPLPCGARTTLSVSQTGGTLLFHHGDQRLGRGA